MGNSHFNIEGSSMNPFSGLQNPLLNRYNNQSYGGGSSYGAVGAAAGGNQVYWPAIYQDSGNAGLAEDFWCINQAENGYEKKVDLMKKKKRRVQVRKASKLRKKLNVVKGQWTPQEDW